MLPRILANPHVNLDYCMCLSCIYYNIIMIVPEELRTLKLFFYAVKLNGIILKFVPEEFKTLDLCLEAIRQNGSALEDVPDYLKTFEMCQEAFNNNFWAMFFIPDKFKTLEMCFEAVGKVYTFINSVPLHLKTLEICNTAYNSFIRLHDMFDRSGSDWGNVNLLEFIPNEFKTYTMCFETAKRDSRSLEFIPEKFIDLDICRFAVKKSGKALQFVPEEFQTNEIIEIALENEPSAKKFIYSRFLVEIFEKVEDQDTNNECGICIDCSLNVAENIKWFKLLDCQHIFHESCIKEWLINNDKNTCPICRIIINFD